MKIRTSHLDLKGPEVNSMAQHEASGIDLVDVRIWMKDRSIQIPDHVPSRHYVNMVTTYRDKEKLSEEKRLEIRRRKNKQFGWRFQHRRQRDRRLGPILRRITRSITTHHQYVVAPHAEIKMSSIGDPCQHSHFWFQAANAGIVILRQHFVIFSVKGYPLMLPLPPKELMVKFADQPPPIGLFMTHDMKLSGVMHMWGFHRFRRTRTQISLRVRPELDRSITRIVNQVKGVYEWQGYCIRGIMVPKDVAEGTYKAADVLKYDNVEVRRIAMERLPMADILKAGHLVLKSKDECGVLYGEKTGLNTNAATATRAGNLAFVRVLNSTSEIDGALTRKQAIEEFGSSTHVSHKGSMSKLSNVPEEYRFKAYLLRVPPNLQTARAAVAWTFSVDAESYKPSFES